MSYVSGLDICTTLHCRWCRDCARVSDEEIRWPAHSDVHVCSFVADLHIYKSFGKPLLLTVLLMSRVKKLLHLKMMKRIVVHTLHTCSYKTLVAFCGAFDAVVQRWPNVLTRGLNSRLSCHCRAGYKAIYVIYAKTSS